MYMYVYAFSSCMGRSGTGRLILIFFKSLRLQKLDDPVLRMTSYYYLYEGESYG